MESDNKLAELLLRADARAEEALARVAVLERERDELRTQLAKRAWMLSVEHMWAAYVTQEGAFTAPLLFGVVSLVAWALHGATFNLPPPPH